MDAKQILKGMRQFLGYTPNSFGLLHDLDTDRSLKENTIVITVF